MKTAFKNCYTVYAQSERRLSINGIMVSDMRQFNSFLIYFYPSSIGNSCPLKRILGPPVC